MHNETNNSDNNKIPIKLKIGSWSLKLLLRSIAITITNYTLSHSFLRLSETKIYLSQTAY